MNNGRRPARTSGDARRSGRWTGERPRAPSAGASARPGIGDRPRAAGGLACPAIPRAADRAAAVAEPAHPRGSPPKCNTGQSVSRAQGAASSGLSVLTKVGVALGNRPKTARPRRPSSGSEKRSANRLRTRCGRVYNRYGDKCQDYSPHSTNPSRRPALDAGLRFPSTLRPRKAAGPRVKHGATEDLGWKAVVRKI